MPEFPPTHVRLRPEIAAMQPYRQGKQAAADAYKLSSNENPYPPLPSIQAAIDDSTPANRYPDGAAIPLREALASRFGVTVDEVHVGAGSVSIIAQLLQAVAVPTASGAAEIVYAWRSFEAYPLLTTVAGAFGVGVPNRADHTHDLDAMAEAITERTAAVLVCTPNNPTGPIVRLDEFEAFMAKVPEHVLVILDEAYIEFVTDPAAVRAEAVLGRWSNLVVLRTFSKAYGLAGLRVGYAIGPVALMDAARATAIPLSVTGAAQAAAMAALQPGTEAELLERVRQITALRDETVAALRAQGWPVPDAQGNFVWLPAGAATEALAERLFAAGLVTRAFAGDGIRVSIGEPEAVERLLSITAESVGVLTDIQA